MIKKVIKVVIILALIAVPLIGLQHRFDIYDAWRLRGYQAPAKVAELATQTTMNDKTRRLFYVYHPELDDKTTFNNRCKSSEQTIVLGCYVPTTGIYLYNVQDVRLTGVQQVTAAHEALHAAYDRLSSNDKKHVNQLIDTAYQAVKDQRIRDTIEDYRKNGADTTNELHSILGTEVRDLPPELEQYYGKYFTNRQAVVSFSEKYEQAFTERKEKIATDDQQLEIIKKQIESGEADLDVKQAAIHAERARLDGLLAAKNIEAYNANVAGFNAQVNAYNAQVRRVRTLIEQYNSLVAVRNALAVEEGQLVKAIDSRPDTLQTQ